MSSASHPEQTARGWTRRAVIRTALVTTAATASGALLAACGGGSNAPVSPTATVGGNPTASPTIAVATTAKPTTIPAASAGASSAVSGMSAPVASTAVGSATGSVTTAGGMTAAAVAPDASGKIPSPLPGVPVAYTKYPDPFTSVNGVPAKSAKVTAFLIAYNPPPPPREQNTYWQELEKRLGVIYEPTLQPADGYPEKMATLTASGNLPDLVTIVPQQVPDQYKFIQQGAYTDLTPYLGGSALKDYPNLARFDDYLWKNVLVNGKIYGVPRAQLPITEQLSWRKDWAEKFGTPQPKNADEFYDLMVKFTKGDPNGTGKMDTYGLHFIAQFAFGVQLFQNMFRAPNVWRKNDNGSLTHVLETPEFKQTIEYMRRLYDAGIFHPETATGNRTQRKDFITGGKVGGISDYIANFAGLTGFRQTARTLLNDPKINITTFIPPGFDGGKPTTDLTTGFFALTAIPIRVGKDKERVKELLRIVDYFAAPFGSEEYTFLQYGLKDVHYTVQKDGSPLKTDKGTAEIGDLSTAGGPMTTYYFPIPGDPAEAQENTRKIAALGQENPCLTLYSPTNASKGGQLNQLRIDRIDALVTGRDPMSALDTLIKDWRSRGGDDMRKEYEVALKGQ